MSIFPKRSVRGGNVTIHWNLNTAAMFSRHITPRIRIIIKDPIGGEYILCDEHILCLPGVKESGNNVNTTLPGPKYLRKELPLMVLANYLAAENDKEMFVEILTRIRDGRHFYFNYPVEPDAPLGKYQLTSEIFIDGKMIRSRTEADDFFYIEAIVISVIHADETACRFHVINNSPEPTPVRIITYDADKPLMAEAIEICMIGGGETVEFVKAGKYHFVSYNEERIIVPVVNCEKKKRTIRNQEYLQLPEKKENGHKSINIIHRQSDEAYILQNDEKYIWEHADGLILASELRKYNPDVYAEMLNEKLIEEINFRCPSRKNI